MMDLVRLQNVHYACSRSVTGYSLAAASCKCHGLMLRVPVCSATQHALLGFSIELYSAAVPAIPHLQHGVSCWVLLCAI